MQDDIYGGVRGCDQVARKRVVGLKRFVEKICRVILLRSRCQVASVRWCYTHDAERKENCSCSDSSLLVSCAEVLVVYNDIRKHSLLEPYSLKVNDGQRGRTQSWRDAIIAIFHSAIACAEVNASGRSTRTAHIRQ